MTILNNSPLCIIWLQLEKKLRRLAQARISWKKNNFAIFSPETRFKKFVFYFFRALLCASFGSNQKIFSSYGASMHFLKKNEFSIFRTKSKLQALVFHFFLYFSDLFFKIHFYWLRYLFFPNFLLLNRKKITSFGTSVH